VPLLIGSLVILGTVILLVYRSRQASAVAAMDPADRKAILESLHERVMAVQAVLDDWPRAFADGDVAAVDGSRAAIAALQGFLKANGAFGWHQLPGIWAALGDAAKSYSEVPASFAKSRTDKVESWRDQYLAEALSWRDRADEAWAKGRPDPALGRAGCGSGPYFARYFGRWPAHGALKRGTR
jgi:hypothetical protein